MNPFCNHFGQQDKILIRQEKRIEFNLVVSRLGPIRGVDIARKLLHTGRRRRLGAALCKGAFMTTPNRRRQWLLLLTGAPLLAVVSNAVGGVLGTPPVSAGDGASALTPKALPGLPGPRVPRGPRRPLVPRGPRGPRRPRVPRP